MKVGKHNRVRFFGFPFRSNTKGRIIVDDVASSHLLARSAVKVSVLRDSSHGFSASREASVDNGMQNQDPNIQRISMVVKEMQSSL